MNPSSSNSNSVRTLVVAGITCLVLAACGGGSPITTDDSADATAATDASARALADEPTDATEASPPQRSALSVTDQQRVAAAKATAQSSTNACAPIRPFYWEIGDRSAAIVSGSVTSTASPTVYTQATLMSIASASKWLYGAYVAEKRTGALSTDDYKYLNFQSGYTNFSSCNQNQTVGQCDTMGTNGAYTAANDGKFYYNGGHMEKHATLMGLGAMNNAALAGEMKSRLGITGTFIYTQPQLAGGVLTSPAVYATFLRKLLNGQLRLGSMLGTHAVCTNPRTCPAAVSAPLPPTESWHYSIGHWVEDDPNVGDGAFSSPGLFGFYPWVDASKSYYGILARVMPAGALDSVGCGRIIRKAWETGVTQ